MKRRKQSGIALPWERTGPGWRSLFSVSRWKTGLLIVAVLFCGTALVRKASGNAALRETRAAIEVTHRAVARFRLNEGRCPASLDELTSPPTAGVRYLRQLPRDAWGNLLYVRCPGHFAAHGIDGVDVISAGPSGSLQVDDNVL